MRTPHHVVRCVALLAAVAAPLGAQLSNTSAAATGLGDNYTAVARGVHAMAWNPAGLGMPGNPAFSVVSGGSAEGGLAPVNLSDLSRYRGELLPDAVRDAWLVQIRAEGSLRLHVDMGGTGIAFNAGRFGFQFGTQVHGVGELAPDAAEVVLFGNAGRTGEAREMTFAGTHFLTSAVSTVAMGYAQPLTLTLGPLPDQHFAVGVTAKYIVGHGLAMGRDRSSVATPLEVTVDFPVVQSTRNLSGFGNAGGGYGLDVGASWQGGPFALGAAVQNVVNTFAWNVDDFYWRAGQATYDGDGSSEDFDSLRTMESAPDDVRATVTDLRYAPVIAVGGSWKVSPRVLLVADARQRVSEGGMNAGAETHVGAGVELRPVRFLPLRVGGSRFDDGYRLAGGLGVELGWFNVALSVGRRIDNGGAASVGAFTVSFGTR
jgi:hypothetical protein